MSPSRDGGHSCHQDWLQRSSMEVFNETGWNGLGADLLLLDSSQAAVAAGSWEGRLLLQGLSARWAVPGIVSAHLGQHLPSAPPTTCTTWPPIRQWTGIVWHSSIVWAGAYLGDRRLGRTPQNGQGGENDVWNQAGKYIWVRLLDREVEDFLVWFNHFCKVHLSQMNYHSFVIPINSSQNVPVRIPSN